MDQNQQNNQIPTPQADTQPVPPPVTSTTPSSQPQSAASQPPQTQTSEAQQPSNNIPKKFPSIWQKMIPILIIALLAILTGTALFFVLHNINNQEEPPEPITVVVTPTPTPTPIRNATVVSTSPQFTEFVHAISTLSTTINEFERDDPSLSPPSLILPLGFPN
jgi:hypothetical protein